MKRFLLKSKWLIAMGFVLPWSYNGYAQQLAAASPEKGSVNKLESSLLLKEKNNKPTRQVPQTITVKGQVKDETTGEGLPGVNVIIKGTSQGTVTDIEGNYSLSVPNADAILMFKYIGYKEQEQKVGSRNVINVAMKAGAASLDEVVVVGYGEQKRANLTGAVETLQAKEVEDLPVGNLAQAIVGRMAGVRVSMATGKPGSANPLVIRRQTDKSRNPDVVLYVIDGVIYDDGGEQFNMLDATEVESISILKDGAAAVYGARAGGGVVLVKTKRGGKGKPKFSFSSSLGIGQPTEVPEMLTGTEHARLLHEIFEHENGKYRNDPRYELNRRRDTRYFTEDEFAAIDTLDYDWLDGTYKSAITTRHTLNVSGGSENLRYFVGGGYFKETGNIQSLQYERYSFRTNLEADVTKDVTFTLGLSTNRGSGNEPYFEGESNLLRNTYTRLMTAPRWIPHTIDGMPVNVEGTSNPYATLGSDSYRSRTSANTNITGALEYRVPFIKGLKARGQISYNDNQGGGRRYAQDVFTYAFRKTGGGLHLYSNELVATNARRPQGNGEGLEINSDRQTFYQLNTSLTYNRTFGAHQLDALLVYEQQESEVRSIQTVKTGARFKGFDELWAFSDAGVIARGNASESGGLATIGRINYNYKGKYLFESSFRYEASQSFHPDYAWGFFPNVSGGWIISEEGFFRDHITFIDFLKVRASYGRVGTKAGRAFQWKQTYGTNRTGPLFGTGDTPNLSGAIEANNFGESTPNLTWQKGDIYNVGVDARVLNNKINIGFDAFYRYNFDILEQVVSNAPTTYGLPRAAEQNYSAGYNKGFELSLGFNDNIGNDFGYNIGGNISWNYGRPTKIPQNPAVIGRWDDLLLNDPSNQPGLIALGIIRTEEDKARVLEMYPDINGVPVDLGMIYYKDIRGQNYSEGPDGKIDEFDRTIIAERTNAPWVYGFTLGASWKKLRASATFSGGFGHKVFIQKDEMVLPTVNSNVLSIWKDYWTPENPNAAMPRPYQYGYEGEISTFWMRDGHTLRLNNINVSYDLPTKIAERWRLPQFRVFYAGTNIWTVINPFDHKDPSISRAYDYPMVTTSNFGLNVTF